MAFDKKDFNKRRYNYGYRPFFWSLHIKADITSNKGESTDSNPSLSEKDT